MPLAGAKYRYKKGTKTRLAFKDGQVVEAKNMVTGATHSPAEFMADKKKKRTKGYAGAYEPLKPQTGPGGLMEG
jgi:hypothetical protein